MSKPLEIRSITREHYIKLKGHMRTEYISITVAIQLFEDYEIDCTRDAIIKYAHASGMPRDEDVFMTVHEIPGLYPNAGLPSLIAKQKIKLYGKNQLSDDKEQLVVIHDFPSACNFCLRNSYDYTISYNTAINYDVICCIINNDVIYKDVSIKYIDLVTLIRSFTKKS